MASKIASETPQYHCHYLPLCHLPRPRLLAPPLGTELGLPAGPQLFNL